MTPANRYFSDVSSNNGSFSAPQYASAGHTIVAIKATEGTGYTNPFYREWVHDAHEHGLAVIHYHFALPQDGDPSAEAEHFISTVRPEFKRPGDYLAFDVEQGTITQAKDWIGPAYEFVRSQGYHPWLYTFLSFYEQGLTIPSHEYWLAAWGNERPSVRRGHNLLAWQYTDGQVGPEPHAFAGIPKVADGDLLDVSLAAQLARTHRR